MGVVAKSHGYEARAGGRERPGGARPFVRHGFVLEVETFLLATGAPVLYRMTSARIARFQAAWTGVGLAISGQENRPSPKPGLADA